MPKLPELPWRKKHTAEEFLGHVVHKLEKMDDTKKMEFLKEKLPAIQTALESVSLKDPANYLHWHSAIASQLPDVHKPFNPAHPPDELDVFHKATQDKTIAAFQKYFAIDPLRAINSLFPHCLYQSVIEAGLEELTGHDNPTLFFDCVDAVQINGKAIPVKKDKPSEREKNKLYFQNRMTDSTKSALLNLLEKDALELLALRGLASPAATSLSYIEYLPPSQRAVFIESHLDKIVPSLREIAPKAGANHLRGFRKIWDVFTDDADRPKQFAALRQLLSVKSVFAVAADSAQPDLSAIFEKRAVDTGFDQSLAMLIGVSPEKDHNQNTLLRITNPCPLEDAGANENLGEYSQYLWLVADRKKNVLAAAFTEVGIRGYLQHQRQFDASTMLAGIPVDRSLD